MSEEETKNAKDIAKLRKDVDALQRKVHAGKRIYKTDFAEHIEDLNRQIKKRDVKAAVVNTFVVGKQVKLSATASVSLHAIAPGTIKYMACKLATPSAIKQVVKSGGLVRGCDKKTCAHDTKDYIWVEWSNGRLFAYHFSQLQPMTAEDNKPRIGKELSGRIGEWTYDAGKKTWMRDGSDKELTNDEFEDVIYWEMHPYDKADGDDFIKALKREVVAEKEVETSK